MCLPQIPHPSRLPDSVNQSSLFYTVGPCLLTILNAAEDTSQSQTP